MTTALLSDRMEQARVLLRQRPTFAVVGASQDREKYGHEVLEALWESGFHAIPINPKYAEIDSQPCYPSLAELPHNPEIVVTAAPASVSEKIAETCAALGIPYFWMPTGTETDAALEICQQNGVTAIYGFCPVFLLKNP